MRTLRGPEEEIDSSPFDLPVLLSDDLDADAQITTMQSRSLRCCFIALSSSECRLAYPVGFGRRRGPPAAPSLF